MSFNKQTKAQMKKEMKMKGLNEYICDCVEETIETESAKAEYIYGKGAKGEMCVKIELLEKENRICVKATFKPAEGVRPLEGRADFGITRTKDFVM